MSKRKSFDTSAARYSVSYYVPEERYWQFAGEYEDREQAVRTAAILRADGRGMRARVRRLG